MFSIQRRDYLAKQSLLDEKALDSDFTTRRTCYAGSEHSRW